MWRRTIVILSFFILCGWISYLMVTVSLSAERAMAVLGLASSLAVNYITIKGRNAIDNGGITNGPS